MKVMHIRQVGDVEGLKPEDAPEPKPGPGQVRVRVRAASLNYRDLMVVKGAYNPKMPLPRIPCSDGVGEVAELGPGVTRVKAGQRVAGIFMQKWIAGELTDDKARSALGGAIDGLLAEYAVLHEEGVTPVPEHLSDEEAATLPCAAVTAWNGLVASGGVKPGDSVLVQGTGGVSLFVKFVAGFRGWLENKAVDIGNAGQIPAGQRRESDGAHQA